MSCRGTSTNPSPACICRTICSPKHSDCTRRKSCTIYSEPASRPEMMSPHADDGASPTRQVASAESTRSVSCTPLANRSFVRLIHRDLRLLLQVHHTVSNAAPGHTGRMHGAGYLGGASCILRAEPNEVINVAQRLDHSPTLLANSKSQGDIAPTAHDVRATDLLVLWPELTIVATL